MDAAGSDGWMVRRPEESQSRAQLDAVCSRFVNHRLASIKRRKLAAAMHGTLAWYTLNSPQPDPNGSKVVAPKGAALEEQILQGSNALKSFRGAMPTGKTPSPTRLRLQPHLPQVASGLRNWP